MDIKVYLTKTDCDAVNWNFWVFFWVSTSCGPKFSGSGHGSCQGLV